MDDKNTHIYIYRHVCIYSITISFFVIELLRESLASMNLRWMFERFQLKRIPSLFLVINDHSLSRLNVCS